MLVQVLSQQQLLWLLCSQDRGPVSLASSALTRWAAAVQSGLGLLTYVTNSEGFCKTLYLQLLIKHDKFCCWIFTFRFGISNRNSKPMTLFLKAVGLWTNSTSSTWELVGDGEPQALPQTSWTSPCLLTKSLGASWAHPCLRSSAPFMSPSVAFSWVFPPSIYLEARIFGRLSEL